MVYQNKLYTTEEFNQLLEQPGNHDRLLELSEDFEPTS